MAETELKRKAVFMITLIIQLCCSRLGRFSHFLSSSKQRPGRVENSGITFEYDCKQVQLVKQKAAVFLIIVICQHVSSIFYQFYQCMQKGPPLRLALAGHGPGCDVHNCRSADKVAMMLSFPGLTLIRAIKLT